MSPQSPPLQWHTSSNKTTLTSTRPHLLIEPLPLGAIFFFKPPQCDMWVYECLNVCRQTCLCGHAPTLGVLVETPNIDIRNYPRFLLGLYTESWSLNWTQATLTPKLDLGIPIFAPWAFELQVTADPPGIHMGVVRRPHITWMPGIWAPVFTCVYEVLYLPGYLLAHCFPDVCNN